MLACTEEKKLTGLPKNTVNMVALFVKATSMEIFKIIPNKEN